MDPSGFSRTVAIKRMHASTGESSRIMNVILDEARIAARIRHPNVVQTLDVVAEGDEVLLVMEYIAGESLAGLFQVDDKLTVIPLPITASIITQILHGLHAAHSATDDKGDDLRVIHRDVSPHNILVGVDGV
jgi:eukaryotic-like serine/threonine-protein kinase